jgi:hypothetical protein
MACEEQNRLLAEFQGRVRLYSNTVSELGRLRGMTQLEHYRELMHESDVERLNCEEAHLDLERHIAAHRC